MTFFCIFWGFFYGCLKFFLIFYFLFFIYFFLLRFLGFFLFFGIPFKVTRVTSKSYQGNYWTPKVAKNGPKQHNKLFFLPEGEKKPRSKAKAQRFQSD